MTEERIAVVGLGYVGLPVAVALARTFPGVIGYDINPRRIADLRRGNDWTREVDSEALKAAPLEFTDDPESLREATLFVVTVPTPIDTDRRPDLQPLLAACRTIGKVIRPGALVVFESTVYPGATEDVCGPEIARVSGLTAGRDFKLGYSPERINPGDREHTLERVVKVVSGQDADSLARASAVYRRIVPAGIHIASSIKVAEAAKVIENTQRDLNIALMNELAIIFQRVGIRTKDVLEAAATKWNFLRFQPGLVGGHCIGVDPYYLTAKAESLGYHPEMILAGRRINDGMGGYIARQLIKLLVHADLPVKSARIGILGLTFKEDVPDLRNSRVPDIVAELRQFGSAPMVHDPLADPEEAMREHGVAISDLDTLEDLDGMILAVGHSAYRRNAGDLIKRIKSGGVVMDVKSILDPAGLPESLIYWSL